MKYLLLALGLLFAPALAFAQTAPTATYEFMTIVEVQSSTRYASVIMFAPAFQGKTELPLEVLPGALSNKYWPTYQHNLEVVVQQLQAATAAGWELVSNTAHTSGQNYLFQAAQVQRRN